MRNAAAIAMAIMIASTATTPAHSWGAIKKWANNNFGKESSFVKSFTGIKDGKTAKGAKCFGKGITFTLYKPDVECDI